MALKTVAENKKMTTLDQLRKKIWNSTTMNNFVKNFSKVYLRYLNIDIIPLRNEPEACVPDCTNLIRKTRADSEVLKIIYVMKRDKKWSIP